MPGGVPPRKGVAGNIVSVIARMLQEFVDVNDRTMPGPASARSGPQCFEAYQPPPIAVAAYIARVARYSGASVECYVSALILIDRLIHSNPTLFLSSHNVHRLLVTAVMISAKTRDDVYYSNKYYSNIGGVALTEMNYLEAEFLRLMNWDLYVSVEDYCRYLQEIDARYGPLTGDCAEQLARFVEEHPDELPEASSGEDDEQLAGDGVAAMEEDDVDPGASDGDTDMSPAETSSYDQDVSSSRDGSSCTVDSFPAGKLQRRLPAVGDRFPSVPRQASA